MRTRLTHLALQDAECGRSQTDNDSAIARQYFYINVRSIRWRRDTDQRQPPSNTSIEKTIPALFVPEEKRNYIGKAFFETWCDAHGYFRPEIDIVCLEFNLHGQTQRFESVHQIIENGESVQFYSNRSLDKPHRHSLLEEHIRDYTINVSKRHGSAHPKEVVAVRSRTWPSTSSQWPPNPENQYARKQQPEQPAVRLGEPKDYIDTGLPPIDSGEVSDNRGGNRLSPARYDFRGTLPDDISAMMATSPVATYSSGDSPKSDPANFGDTTSSEDTYPEQITHRHDLIDPIPRVVGNIAFPRKSLVDRDDPELKTIFNQNVRYTNSCQPVSMMPAEQDVLSLDEQLQTVESAADHQDRHAELGVDFDASFGSKDHSSSTQGEVLGVEETRSWTRSFMASQQSVQDGTVRSLSSDTDCSEPDLTTGSPTSSKYTASTGELRCHSIIRDIYRADKNWDGVLEQKRESVIGDVRGIHDRSTEQRISSSDRMGRREPELSTKKTQWLDRVSVRKDEPPNSAKSFWPAVASSAAISPAQNVGKPNTPENQYTSAAMDKSNRTIMEHNSGEQEPDDSNEMVTWDLCHESDQDSIYSSDGEGLPFPDDYWVYDEKVKNYYHVEVEDDGTETVSWYPTEFD